jgi:hypothetical protein
VPGAVALEDPVGAILRMEGRAERARLELAEPPEHAAVHREVDAATAEPRLGVEVVEVGNAWRQHDLGVEVVDPGAPDGTPAAVDDAPLELTDPADLSAAEALADVRRVRLRQEGADGVGVALACPAEIERERRLEIRNRLEVEGPLEEVHTPVAELAHDPESEAPRPLDAPDLERSLGDRSRRPAPAHRRVARTP